MKDQFGVLEDRIVYLKPIDKADLPDKVFEETGDIDQLWSVHNSEGEQLALVGDLNQAYDMAREFSYSPMTLHWFNTDSTGLLLLGTKPLVGMVAHNCNDLDLATRLKIVQETSLVECIFVEPSEVADVRFRIYLASREIPFAGHPNLAGVASLQHRDLLNGKRLTVETQAGLIPIEVGENGHIIMTQMAPFFGPVVEVQLVADALSLSVDDIIHPLQIVSICLPFTVAVVRDHDALKRAVLKLNELLKLQAKIDMPDTDIMEPFLVTLSGATSAGDTHARLLLTATHASGRPIRWIGYRCDG